MNTEKYTYTFAAEEVVAVDKLMESVEELLVEIKEITGRIIKHLSFEEAQNILMLREKIRMIYTNYNYYLPSAKPFNDWIREKAKIVAASYC